MRLALIFAVQMFFSVAFANDALIQSAVRLGAPAKAVRRAFEEARSSVYTNRRVISVLDLSQQSNRKRFYVIDIANGGVTSHFASHGKGNGSALKATSFRGFNRPAADKTPLGALMTGSRGYLVDGYETVRDPMTGKVFRGRMVLDIDGTKPYNDRINGDGWAVVFHTKSYATEGYRRQNGAMGRSLGCIVLDPADINDVIGRIQGGSLVYVTVGDEPLERYL